MPTHALCTREGELVLLWSAGGAITLGRFDGRGALRGLLDGRALGLDALDDERAPLVRSTANGAGIVLWLADGRRVLVDLQAGCALDLEDDAAALHAEAAASARSGDLESQVETLERALAKDPSDTEAWRSLARAIERSGDRDAAREVLARASTSLLEGRIKPVSMDWRVCDPRARLAFDLASRYEREGDLGRARAALRTVETLFPCMEEATLHRASLALALDPEHGASAADAILNETIAMLECPRAQSAAHLDAAALLERAGAFDLARTHIAASIALGEDREVVLRALARVELALGDTSAAIAALERLKARWLADHALLEDDRRRVKSKERLEHLEAELASLGAPPSVPLDK
ncbi:MAG: hypothetical protein R3F49_10460 [Planctomycetota bacterium]